MTGEAPGCAWARERTRACPSSVTARPAPARPLVRPVLVCLSGLCSSARPGCVRLLSGPCSSARPARARLLVRPVHGRRPALTGRCSVAVRSGARGASAACENAVMAKSRNTRRERDADAVVEPVDGGLAQLVPDRDRARAWTLLIDGAPSRTSTSTTPPTSPSSTSGASDMSSTSWHRPASPCTSCISAAARSPSPGTSPPPAPAPPSRSSNGTRPSSNWSAGSCRWTRGRVSG